MVAPWTPAGAWVRSKNLLQAARPMFHARLDIRVNPCLAEVLTVNAAITWRNAMPEDAAA
jgi:hypothetical protein